MDPQTIAEIALLPLIVVFGIVAIVARVRRRLELGFGVRRGALWGLPIGFGIGAVAIGLMFLAIWALGGVRIEGVTWDLGGLAGTLLFLLGLSIVEEAAFRGLLMNGLRVALRNTWIAVLVTAVVVGVPYFFAPGASALSITSGVLSGIMYGAAFVLTGRIWLGAGLRTAWNFVQGPILGFPVSGSILLESSVLLQESTGDAWLTGGEYGPEASVPGLVVRVVVIAVLVALILRRSPSVAEPMPLENGR